MQIQPVEPVPVVVHCGQIKIGCYLVELTEHELILSSTEFLDKNSPVTFKSRYFKGDALIQSVSYTRYQFTYTLHLQNISYQPGLLVNTQL